VVAHRGQLVPELVRDLFRRPRLGLEHLEDRSPEGVGTDLRHGFGGGISAMPTASAWQLDPLTAGRTGPGPTLLSLARWTAFYGDTAAVWGP
jgi:hypothetical protein